MLDASTPYVCPSRTEESQAKKNLNINLQYTRISLYPQQTV